jgi:hypothetical protein
MAGHAIADTTLERSAMGSDIVAAAVEIGRSIWSIRQRHRFQAAATNFACLLGGIPDCAAGELGDREIDLLSRLATEVIDAIELRADDHTLCESDEQKLVTLVYRIRQHVEEMESWNRHYGLARPR